MFIRFWILFSLLFLATACSSPSFNVPAKEYREKVKTLGVLPVIVDRTSDINHPQREQVIDLLERNNRQSEERLAEMLRSQKVYFDVRMLKESPQFLFDELVSGADGVGEGNRYQLHYRFNPATVSRIIDTHRVDALLVVIQHGVVRMERRWDRAALAATYLDTPTTLVTVSSYVIDSTGKPLWRLSAERAGIFLDLEYPNFDEAYYNRSDKVRMEYLRLEGIERALQIKSEQAVSTETLSAPYWQLFRRIVADLNPGRAGLFR
jgi:hypothetical protein